MVIQVLETVTKEEEKKREKKLAVCSQHHLSLAHRTVSGAPDWSPVKMLLSGIDDGVLL
jgi:hypothetical protein